MWRRLLALARPPLPHSAAASQASAASRSAAFDIARVYVPRIIAVTAVATCCTAALPFSTTAAEAAPQTTPQPKQAAVTTAAAAPVTSQGIDASPASTAAAASPLRLESPADEECPWCTEMARGPCADEFIAWRNCSKRIKEEEAAELKAAGGAASATASTGGARVRPRHVTECMPLFKLMNVCVRTPGPKRDYYRQLLPMDDGYQPPKQDVEKDLEF